MMFLKVVHILLFLLAFQAPKLCAQEVVELMKYPISNEGVWLVDGLENVVISDRDRMTKYDKNGKILFEQSQKSLTRIDKIEIINSLKMFGFTELQQQVCFFDNSLTSMDKCIDLSEYDFMNVTHVSSSGQSDKLWVFDQVNSSLQLLSMKGLFQNQMVKNLNGIIDADNITQLIEWENNLYVLDKVKGIYVFDIYGTLIRFLPIPDVKWIQLQNDHVLCLKNNTVEIHSLLTEENPAIFQTSYDSIESFSVFGEFIYVQTEKEIVKLEFLFK